MWTRVNGKVYARRRVGMQNCMCRRSSTVNGSLKLLKELAGRAGDEDAAGHAPLAVFHPLHDAGGLAAFGAIRALGGVHLLAVRGLCDFCHVAPDQYCPAARV